MSLEPQRIKKTLQHQLPVEIKEEDSETPLAGTKKVIHHAVFTYPPNPKPNPALADFFEKLNSVKEELNNTHLSITSLSDREGERHVNDRGE